MVLAISIPIVREVDCPRCHEQCGWCSDYRWMHGKFTLPSVRRTCAVPGFELEGDDCPICLGLRRVRATTTYERIENDPA